MDIADYMGTSLEMNDNHTIKNFSDIKMGHITNRTRQTDVIVEHTIYDLYTTLTMLGPKLWGNTLLV